MQPHANAKVCQLVSVKTQAHRQARLCAHRGELMFFKWQRKPARTGPRYSAGVIDGRWLNGVGRGDRPFMRIFIPRKNDDGVRSLGQPFFIVP